MTTHRQSPAASQELGPESISEILALAGCGDQQAFGSFYDATASTVFGMVLSVVSDRGQAEAVAQDVYVEAWKAARTFDDKRWTPAAWLATIVRAQVRLRAERSARQSAWN